MKHRQTELKTDKPPKWKMAIITWMAIVPLILTIMPLMGPVLAKAGINRLLSDIILTTVLVVIMVYMALPLMSHLFKSWLS